MSGTPVVSSISVALFVVIVTSATAASCWSLLVVIFVIGSPPPPFPPRFAKEVGELGSDPDRCENELDELLRGDGR